MIEATAVPDTSARARRRALETQRPARRDGAAPARLGMAAVHAVVAYEWLVTGANKLLLGQTYLRGFPQALHGDLAGTPSGPLARLAERLLLPHAAFVAVAVLLGELAIGLGYAVGAVAWSRDGLLPAAARRWTGPAAAAALLASAVLATSYALIDGEGLPLPNPVNAFGPGIGIDLVLALVAWSLLLAQVAGALVQRADGTAQSVPEHPVY